MGNIFLSVLGISVSVGIMVIGLVLLTPFLNKRYAVKWKYLNGISILICAVVLTIGLGTLIGCSVTNEDRGKENIGNEDAAKEESAPNPWILLIRNWKLTVMWRRTPISGGNRREM